MKKFLTELLFFLLLFTCSQSGSAQSGLVLFTDRGYCASGDTVWFFVPLHNDSFAGNIVHVQFTGPDNRLIYAVKMKSKNGWADGFIPVPDSLGTGMYFLTAFMNEHRSMQGAPVEQVSLMVYNRFDDPPQQVLVPSQKARLTEEKAPVTITANKKTFHPREEASAVIDLSRLNPENGSQVFVRVTHSGELDEKYGGRYNAVSVPSQHAIKNFAETDGYTLSGRVTRINDNEPAKNTLVFLTIPQNQEHLDYYLTAEDGFFHFFLKNATGEGEIILHAVSKTPEDFNITLEPVQLLTENPLEMQPVITTHQQVQFATNVSSSAFFRRLFSAYEQVSQPYFSMPPRFKIPFYGQPTRRVVLSDYIELSDFTEISRELLSGVQWRQKKDDYQLRLINHNDLAFFKDEPLRLINGIPVFSNHLLAGLGSAEIHHIDYVLEERLLGDLSFNGVVAVYLNDQSNTWLMRLPNSFRFQVPHLQHSSLAPDILPIADQHVPDFRQVVYWQRMEAGIKDTIHFTLSDLKGKMNISVVGVTREGKVFKETESIDVK